MGDIWFPPYYLYVDPLVGSCLPSRQATLSLPESYQTKLSPSCQRDCNNKDLQISWAFLWAQVPENLGEFACIEVEQSGIACGQGDAGADGARER